MKTFEKLERVLEELKESPSTKVVEGKNDKKALEFFGIDNIKTIHGPLPEFADSLKESGKDIIILTDFDRRGRMTAERLDELLKNDGVTVDLSYRREIRGLARIQTFEELVPRYNELKEKSIRGAYYGKNLYRYSKIRSPRKRGNRWNS